MGRIGNGFCGAQPPTFLVTDLRDSCIGSPGHTGEHFNERGTQWSEFTPDLNRPILTRPNKCSSITCTNRVSEGQFVVVAFPKQRVTLILCAPCAEVLAKATVR